MDSKEDYLNAYQVQQIFESKEFNDLEITDLKKKYKSNKDLLESLCKLKELQTGLMLNCQLSKDMLDHRGNRIMGWSVGEKRGGFDYFSPLEWIGFGLKVLNKYDNDNNSWITLNDKKEWAVAYHGVGRNSDQVGKIVKLILSGGFKVGSGQAYKDEDDILHPGKKVGIGVYFQRNTKVSECYAGKININENIYSVILMCKVNPNNIRAPCSSKDYWILNGTIDEVRPYRILLKQCKENNNYFFRSLKELSTKEKFKINKKKSEIIKERKIQKKEILERRNRLRKEKPNNNKEAIKKDLEDMCILGIIMKEEII